MTYNKVNGENTKRESSDIVRPSSLRTVFSLEIRAKKEPSEIWSVDDYMFPGNINGNPKSNTIRLMGNKGYETIKDNISGGEPPIKVKVLFGSDGNIRVESSYSPSHERD